MQGRYEVSDLLKLRQSPLVVKPKGLPPIEEWMGVVEAKRQTAPRGKFEEPSTQTESFQKRPTLLDTANRRSTTDGAGIHLGPPRNSFASSNATRSRNGTHERTKTNEDIDTKLPDRRSGTFGVVSGKFGARADAENGTDRARRRIDEEENEARPRREFDRTKWNNRDNQIDGEKLDDPGLRIARDGPAREKYNQPWTRKEKFTDQEENRRDNPAWRRGQRDREFERQDAEPEWVDSTETPESTKQHTHEDFLRWKESMTGKPTSESKPLVVEEQIEKIVEPAGLSQSRVASDTIVSGDKFFAKFEESKSSARPTKSRFANIFGPKEPTKTEVESPISSLIPVAQPAELEQPVPSAEPEKKVDADFAKLLAMLGKNESSQAQSKSRPPRSPVNIAELASARSPDLPTNNIAPSQTRTPLTSHTPQLSLDRLIESRSPAHHEQIPQAKPGAQELLELLQRSNLDRQEPRQPAYVQQEQRNVPPPPGLSGFHDRDRPGPLLISTRREISRSIFDDPAFAGFRAEQQQQQQHHPPQNVSAPIEHGGGLENLLQYMQKGYQPYGMNVDRPTQNPPMPPGLQRPPGLDSRPPPGWTGNPPPPPPQAQRQSSHHMPVYGLGPQQNIFTNQPQNTYAQGQQRDQRLPQPSRKPTSDLPGFTNYPPPGFGPSPPFASPTAPEPYGPGAMRNDYGPPDRIPARDRVDRQGPPPPPPQQQNPFAAMYGGAGSGRSNGGGVQLPPGFR